MRARVRIVLTIALVLCGRDVWAQSQDLGHRLPGGAGLDAGTQHEQGIYVASRFAWFTSDRVNDRNGDRVPLDHLDIDVFAGIFGIAGILKVHEVYLTAAVAVPIAKRSVSAEGPEVSRLDRSGLGDIFIEPFKIGVRTSHADAVASYSFYAPTSQGASMLGSPQWAHQVAAGGTVYFDAQRGWRISMLASYLHNMQKLGIDITRGDSVLIQGGVGGRLFGVLELGVDGYSLWQVTDDSGTDLPAQLRGARERALGLGPEVAVIVRPLRSRLYARLEWDVGGKARPVGQILVVGLAVIAWR